MKTDQEILDEMERSLSVPLIDSAHLFRLSQRLTNLRDALSFEDDQWFEAVTYEIVSIDSAASAFDEGGDMADAAPRVANEAIAKIQKLLSEAAPRKAS